VSLDEGAAQLPGRLVNELDTQRLLT